MIHKQKGITVVGLLVLILSILFVTILITRVVPAYINAYEVQNSIKALRSMDGSFFSEDPMTNVTVLKSKLLAQLDINGVKDITTEQIKIVPGDDNKYLVTVKYTVIKPLFYNISLMFDFNEVEEISVSPK